MTKLSAYLRLARISNLPTVWSNVLAASVLAGGMDASGLLQTAFAMSFLYVGGMFLNDAFDRDIDTRERPKRPLPSGIVAPLAVWAGGLGFLLFGVVILAAFGLYAGLAGLALAAVILIYDAWHKDNPLAPLVMGACRALVYVGTAAAAGAAPTAQVLGASLALLAYVAALTYAAREEASDRVGSWWPFAFLALPVARALACGSVDGVTLLLAALTAVIIGIALWLLRRRFQGNVRRAIGLLIAVIALNDAVVASASASLGTALACLNFFFLTLLLQRFVPGT